MPAPEQVTAGNEEKERKGSLLFPLMNTECGNFPPYFNQLINFNI